MRNSYSATCAGVLSAAVLLAAGCGGGTSNSAPMPSPAPAPAPAPPPPPPTLDPQYLASAPSPFAANCDGVPPVGTLYVNAEVEPSLALNPQNPRNLVASWQEDRWSSGGSRGIVVGVSLDGGTTWTQRALPFSRCGGGTPANGGDYARVSNAWMATAPNGNAYIAALAFTGGVLQAGSTSAVLASRSTDGGVTWGSTTTLIRDTDNAFSDKVAITADPVTPHFVYAVWDRLVTLNAGPTYLARSRDDGATWETARPIYDPGTNNQTISNALVVLPNGTLITFFVNVVGGANNSFTSSLALIRSSDNGATWSNPPIKIADNFSVGTRDPDTGNAVRDSSLVPDIAVGPGGSLVIVWQDARFSGGARDAIAVSISNDGGFTWSAPAQASTSTTVAAFTPNVRVRSDGLIGISYFDFRPNTADRNTLPTDFWLTRSRDGQHWQENQVTGPFDMLLAPVSNTDAKGYFLGDYQSLIVSGTTFVPMYARTTNDANNRTDIYAAPAVSVTTQDFTTSAQEHAVGVSPQEAARAFRAAPQWQRDVSDNIARTLQARRMRGQRAE